MRTPNWSPTATSTPRATSRSFTRMSTGASASRSRASTSPLASENRREIGISVSPSDTVTRTLTCSMRSRRSPRRVCALTPPACRMGRSMLFTTLEVMYSPFLSGFRGRDLDGAPCAGPAQISGDHRCRGLAADDGDGLTERLIEYQHVVEREIGELTHRHPRFTDQRAQRDGVFADCLAA